MPLSYDLDDVARRMRVLNRCDEYTFEVKDGELCLVNQEDPLDKRYFPLDPFGALAELEMATPEERYYGVPYMFYEHAKPRQ